MIQKTLVNCVHPIISSLLSFFILWLVRRVCSLHIIICLFFFFQIIHSLPYDKILDWSKLKKYVDDNFEFDVNSRKFSNLVENTVGKGEIARYEQFLLFPQCFQKACFPEVSKGVIVREWVNSLHWLC